MKNDTVVSEEMKEGSGNVREEREGEEKGRKGKGKGRGARGLIERTECEGGKRKR